MEWSRSSYRSKKDGSRAALQRILVRIIKGITNWLGIILLSSQIYSGWKQVDVAYFREFSFLLVQSTSNTMVCRLQRATVQLMCVCVCVCVCALAFLALATSACATASASVWCLGSFFEMDQLTLTDTRQLELEREMECLCLGYTRYGNRWTQATSGGTMRGLEI